MCAIQVILKPIEDHLYSTIDREQAGFRPGSCVDHINTLRLIIEQSAEYHSDLHLVFVDFEKAFDSVDRKGLWMALRRRGIANKLVSVIKSTYNGAKCRVPFQVVGSGVRQGCILSAVLFLVVIGDIIQASTAKHHSESKYSGIRWKMDRFLQHLDYADDMCLL